MDPPSAVQPQRVVSELELIAPPHKQTQRSVAPAVIARRLGKAALEEVKRSLQLVPGSQLDQCTSHQLAGNAELPQPPLDALGSPEVQRAPIGRKPLGEAGIVEVALLAERGDHSGGDGLRHAAPFEMSMHLSHCAIAPPQMLVGESEGAIELVRAQAACSSIAGSASTSATGASLSIGFTPSRSMPSAS